MQVNEQMENNKVREKCVEFIGPLFSSINGNQPIISTALDLARENKGHCMKFSNMRVLEAFFALVRKGVTKVVDKNETSFGNYIQ